MGGAVETQVPNFGTTVYLLHNMDIKARGGNSKASYRGMDQLIAL